MKLYTTRRECEILLSCLRDKTKDVPLSDLHEYGVLVDRITVIMEKQCKSDKSHYVEK